MAINFPSTVYLPCFDTFARSVTFYPVVSQPGIAGFAARGIFDTNETDVVAMDGSIVTNARTELDIFQPEWAVYPRQGDIVDIPWEDDVDGGVFTIADVHGFGNAGGELTLILSRYEPSKLTGYLLLANSYSVGALDFAAPAGMMHHDGSTLSTQ
jgi:hypothetical protein